MRLMSSTGMSAAPVTAARNVASLDLSATVSNEWYSVGGPGSIVIRSASTSSTTRSRSNTDSGTIVAPRRNDATKPAFNPKVWKYGLIIR